MKVKILTCLQVFIDALVYMNCDGVMHGALNVARTEPVKVVRRIN